MKSGLFGTIWRTAITLIAILVAADIAGVLLCTLFDITPLRFKSALLPYAIWLVLGGFAGLFSYAIAGGWSAPRAAAEGAAWTDDPATRRIGRIVVATSAAIIAGLIAAFNAVFWDSSSRTAEFFVPDSASHSLVFLLAALAAIAGSHHVLGPNPQDTR